jgi:hypothetical protein
MVAVMGNDEIVGCQTDSVCRNTSWLERNIQNPAVTESERDYPNVCSRCTAVENPAHPTFSCKV